MRYFFIRDSPLGTPQRFWNLQEVTKADAEIIRTNNGNHGLFHGHIKQVEDVSKDLLLSQHFTPKQLGIVK